MSHDKQLKGTSFRKVQAKQQLDQALNAKEFAVLAGVCYSKAREWFRLPGFPSVRGMVFWQDFVLWRRSQFSLGFATDDTAKALPRSESAATETATLNNGRNWPEKAARILNHVT